MATIEQLLPGGSGAPAYVLALRGSQYFAYHVGGALLTRVVGDAVLANKLLLVGVALSWPLAIRSLLSALGRDPRAAAFAPLVFWNRALLVGFLPFVAALPLAVFAVAVTIRQCRAPTRARAAGLAMLGVLLFYTHLSAWLTASAIGGAIAIASCFTEAAPPARANARPILTTLPALVPSAIAALVWWSSASLAIRGRESTDVDRAKLIDALSLMPPWTFDVWTGHLDEVAACGWWVAYGIIVAAGLRRQLEPRGRWLVASLPFVIVTIVYLATPFRVGAAGLLNVRLSPLVTLFAIVALRPRDDRWGTIPLALCAASTLWGAGSTIYEIRRVARENIGGEIDALVRSMRPGSRLSILNFGSGPRRMFEWPYPFAGAIHRARGGGVVAFSFVEVPHWSVHYAANEGPPARPFLWVYNPCVYRFEDGWYWDYVLVQGTVDMWPPRTPGPPFAAVAHSGVFTLFERVAGPAIDAPDRSPCTPPVAPVSSGAVDGGAAPTYGAP